MEGPGFLEEVAFEVGKKDSAGGGGICTKAQRQECAGQVQGDEQRPGLSSFYQVARASPPARPTLSVPEARSCLSSLASPSGVSLTDENLRRSFLP